MVLYSRYPDIQDSKILDKCQIEYKAKFGHIKLIEYIKLNIQILDVKVTVLDEIY